MKYEVIIYWSREDDAFVAEVPELPGCMADGRTHREALGNVERVAAEWMAVAKETGRDAPRRRQQF
ncbi:MAG: type II toxin-antitoxin system HicB family antitoxin [Phycisphaerales bacterium]|nr:type II toxin-antitoxin system HicB family antitoxin [Phycisphaerales bacterium]